MQDPPEDEDRFGLSGLLEIYAELYPSIRERVRVISTIPDPAIQAKLALLMRMVDRRSEARAAELSARFGLTRAEAALARWLADGGSVTGFAESRRVSPGTVRTHLKSIFAKTGVHRQAQLASLILGRSRGPMRDG